MNFKCIADLKAHWQAEKGVNDLDLATEICPPNMTGDVTLNCFRLAKPLKGNPMQIAAEAVEFLKAHPEVTDAEAVKAFVNFTLTEAALFRDTVGDGAELMDSVALPDSEQKRVLIEYSAPNTNKPLHLGHLRNNSLGMALVEILKRVGHTVFPVNLVNDRGVHICKSMLAYQRFGEGIIPDTAGRKGDHFVGDFYVKYATELGNQIDALKAANPELADKGEDELFLKTEIGQATQKMLQDWEDEVPEVRDLWKMMNGWVLEGFDDTYKRMGVYFDKTFFESDTYKLGRDVIKAGLAKGVFYKRDDGATEIDLSSKKLDKKVVLRSDGTSVYITQDIGTTILKADEFKPDSMIWVVGDEQIYHFRVLFEICKALGYPWADDLHHMAYGMVNLPHGKMKSREGTVVDADNMFDEMHELAKAAVLQRIAKERDITPESTPELQQLLVNVSEAESEEKILAVETLIGYLLSVCKESVPKDLERRSEVIGIGATKFMLLKVNPKNSMKFDPEAAVKFEGDTGALLQYSYARIASIQRKAAEAELSDIIDWSLCTEPKERELALKCAEYPAIMQKAATDYDTGCLCSYLLELARLFNSFYHDCPVMKGDVSPELRKTRLELIDRVKTILEDGLRSLTIETLEAM